MTVLQTAYEKLQPEQDFIEPTPETPPAGAASRVVTAVPLERLRELSASLNVFPPDFTIHRKLERVREKKGQFLDAEDERTVDWASAEELAYASILADGVSIRLTGEDVERGTFSHRHAVFHDAVTGQLHVPLQQLPQATAAFEIHNSPLTENAVIGFEYGYNIQEPSRLVIWEAQYGDFINGAQVMIDEFIVSARGKWGLRPSLVLLLPHAHEGQGPDHASARPERFLQLAADTNIRVANCTTAAQFFHLLRRQAALLTVDPLPLVVLTPKSLLRHPLVPSTPRELAEGSFQKVIRDSEADGRPEAIKRLLFCSGKVYADLVSAEARAARTDVAIVRVEQLYPVPKRELRAAIEQFPNLEQIVWVQEEPENMGVWDFIRPWLFDAADGRPVTRVARPRSASPAEGSASRHALNQQVLVEQAFGVASQPASAPQVAPDPTLVSKVAPAGEGRPTSRPATINPRASRRSLQGLSTHGLQHRRSRSRRIDCRRAHRQVAAPGGRPGGRRRPAGGARDRQNRPGGQCAPGWRAGEDHAAGRGGRQGRRGARGDRGRRRRGGRHAGGSGRQSRTGRADEERSRTGPRGGIGQGAARNADGPQSGRGSQGRSDQRTRERRRGAGHEK
jgi:hypothetical protein